MSQARVRECRHGTAHGMPVMSVWAWFQSSFLPNYPERISSVAPRGSFSRDVVGRCPIRVWGGPVEPATVVKVEAPLNGRVLWKGLPLVSRPRACSGNPYRINKKGQHKVRIIYQN